MSPEIRPATVDDDTAIETVLTTAFPTAVEAKLVGLLRDSGDVLTSLVYEDKGQIIGHVLLSPMVVEADGKFLTACGLRPLAVVPQCQRQGIGDQLVRRAVADAQNQHQTLMFLLGSPDYYRRFGFSAQTARPFASPYAGPFFQALILDDAFVLPKSGTAHYAPAFAAVEQA
jgi:putative acetyltransferase